MAIQQVEVDAYDPVARRSVRLSGEDELDNPRLRDDAGALATVRGNVLSLVGAGGGRQSVAGMFGADEGIPAAAWSPDGRFLAFQALGGNGDSSWSSGELYLLDTQTGTECSVTDPAASGVAVRDVAWLPDGELVVSTGDGLYRIAADLSTMWKLPLPALDSPSAFDVSRDGAYLAWAGRDTGGVHQVWLSRLDGSGLRQLTREAGEASAPHFSPDGSVIAYVWKEQLWAIGLNGSGATLLGGSQIDPRTGRLTWVPNRVKDILQWVPARDLSAWHTG